VSRAGKKRWDPPRSCSGGAESMSNGPDDSGQMDEPEAPDRPGEEGIKSGGKQADWMTGEKVDRRHHGHWG
jgi:hypothetical protein